MTEETEGKSAPDEDVTVYYRPTENCVSEEVAKYFHAYVQDQENGFIWIMSPVTKRPVAIFAQASVVRIDLTPHEGPITAVPTKGHPTLP